MCQIRRVKKSENNDSKELQIRNSIAKFLFFTSENSENSIDVMEVGENVWLTQDMIAKL